MATNPLDALLTLQSGPGVSNAATNPALALQALRKSRLDEAARNRQLAPLGPNPMMTGATDYDVQDLQKDLNEDPSTGLAAQKQTSDIDAANLHAILSGYGGTSKIDQGPLGYSASGGTLSPAAKMAQAERQDAIAKSRIPLDVENASVAGAQALEAQKIAADRAAKEAERAQGEKEYGQFQQFLTAHPELHPTGIDFPGAARGRLSFANPTQAGDVPKLPAGQTGQAIQKKIADYYEAVSPTTPNWNPFYTDSIRAATAANLKRQLDSEFPGWERLPRLGAGQTPAAPPAGPVPAGPQAKAQTRTIRNPNTGETRTQTSVDGGATWR